MAKRSGMYKFEKRSKELKRKKKQDAKLQKRQNKDGTGGGGPEIDYSLCTTAGAAGVDLTPLIEEQEKAAAEAIAELQESEETEEPEQEGEAAS